jgi:hypothetical protein
MRVLAVAICLALLLGGCSGRARHYTWNGMGNGSFSFLMPSGPLPFFSSNPWTLRYRLRCYGLKTIPGVPHTYARPIFSVDLYNKAGGNMGGVAASTDVDTHHVDRFPNGGELTLVVHARPTCQWTIWVASS